MAKFLRLEQFSCRCGDCGGGSNLMDPELVEGLDELCELVGTPLHIERGYICPDSRVTTGGYHSKGLAADVAVPRGMTLDDMKSLAELIPMFEQGGIGMYDSYIHLDNRGRRVRWDRRRYA